ncbi:MAG TPA: hypothetical protein VIL41_03175 [Coriobacteriia bacterium]
MSADVPTESSAPPSSSSPTQLLRELAERDLGIVTEEEFQTKKSELLGRDW